MLPHGEPFPGSAERATTALIRRLWRLIAAVLGCLVLVVLLGIWNISRGEPNIEIPDALRAILDGTTAGGADGAVATFLVRELRLPRLLLGLLAGCALGLAGVILQDTLRNPIADPGLLGVSQAASLAIAVLFFFPGLIPEPLTPAIALGAGLVAGAILVMLARSIRDPVRLILIGALMAAFLATLTSIVLLLVPNSGGFNLTRFMTYQIGSLSGASWDRLLPVLPWLVLPIPVALLVGRTLNILQLGDDVAAGLGMDVTRTRLRLLFVAVVLVAPVVWVAGPIAFVALLSPHVARSLLATSNAHLVLPASAAVGAVVVLIADTAGRLLFFPSEVPAGIWTIVIVGPVAAILAGPRLRAVAASAGPA